MTGHKILRGKDEYLELDRMKLKLKVGDAMISLGNLFDGDPVLGTVNFTKRGFTYIYCYPITSKIMALSEIPNIINFSIQSFAAFLNEKFP
jgi:hypothetical protein